MGPSDRNVLEVQGLTVRFDTSERSVVAVKDLGFHVRAGEVLAIVGESGSGKSVTSLSVMRLIEHGGGTIASGKISFTRQERWKTRSGQGRRQCHAHYPGRRNFNDFSGAHDLPEPRVLRGDTGSGGGHAPSGAQPRGGRG